MRSKLTHRIDDGVTQSGLFLRFAQPLLVGLHICEIQRVRRAEAAVDQLIAGLEQQVDPLARIDFEVMLALGTYVQVGFEIGLPDRGPAPWALGPQPFCAYLAFARIGTVVRAFAARAGEIAVFALEPGHTEPHCKWMKPLCCRRRRVRLYRPARGRPADRHRLHRSSPAAAA